MRPLSLLRGGAEAGTGSGGASSVGGGVVMLPSVFSLDKENTVRRTGVGSIDGVKRKSGSL